MFARVLWGGGGGGGFAYCLKPKKAHMIFLSLDMVQVPHSILGYVHTVSAQFRFFCSAVKIVVLNVNLPIYPQVI